jgi:hypothetical protein
VVPAIIVGGLTAWYLGLRFGIIIAVITAVALLIATVIPGMSLTVYALVVAWAAALYFFGPRISKASGNKGLGGGMFGGIAGGITGGVGQARSWAKKLFGNDKQA